MDDLKRILYEVQGNHIVFLDGVTDNNTNEEILGKGWFMKDQEQHRLVVVSSLVCRWKAKPEDDEMLNLREHFVSSWTLDEYYKAVEDNELFQAVKPQLDASNDLDPAVFRSVGASNTDGVTPDHTALWRQEQVKSKFYFAGRSFLHMFDCSTAEVVASLDIAAKVISKANATRTVDGRWADAVYQLYRHRGGGVTLYDGANEIHWPEDTIHTFNPLDITKLPVAGWLKPLKYNQGGYDAVYIDQDQGLVRFVQVTLAHKHSFRVRYFSEFFELLSKSSSSFEVETLEIFFVIDQRVLKDFKIDVTGEGLLAAFPGWGKYKEKGKVRRVGIQGVDSWEDFDW